jgi:hypothetical protein
MKIKNREIFFLKRKLKMAGIEGLALDIDETLSFTFGYLIEKLIKKFGNPEKLTVLEIAKKYKHTDRVPYWQNEEVHKEIDEITFSNEAYKNSSLIENANEVVQEINKIIPIVAYITARPSGVFKETKYWLKKHNFPEATLITKPKNISRREGNKWKARVLEYLYPQVVGIVDDNPDLTKFFSKEYKGVVYLYDNVETKRKDISVIPCEDWKMVAKKVKECRI